MQKVMGKWANNLYFVYSKVLLSMLHETGVKFMKLEPLPINVHDYGVINVMKNYLYTSVVEYVQINM